MTALFGFFMAFHYNAPLWVWFVGFFCVLMDMTTLNIGTDEELERVKAEAYQVIAALAMKDTDEQFSDADIIRALDYFSGKKIDGDILPWPRGDEP